MIRYPYSAGTDLRANKSVAKGDTLALQPWDAAIVEEK